MTAELSIDEEGRAVLVLQYLSDAEHALLERFKAFLPITAYLGHKPWSHIVIGDRMPGMGNLTAQDATSPTVSTEESIARRRDPLA